MLFDLPSAEDLARYTQTWLERKKIVLDTPADVGRVAEVLGGASIADAEAILQGAVNRAVSRRESPVRVRLEDFQRAASLVNGG